MEKKRRKLVPSVRRELTWSIMSDVIWPILDPDAKFFDI